MTRQRQLLLAFLLAAWVGMVVACGGGGSTGKSETRPRSGETGIIYIPDHDDVAVAIDATAHDEWIKAAVAKDEIGIKNLILSERVLIMPARTKVLVLKPGIATEIRILDGPYAERKGFIAFEFIHSIGEENAVSRKGSADETPSRSSSATTTRQPQEGTKTSPGSFSAAAGT